MSDLAAAAAALELAQDLVAGGLRRLKELGGPDAAQVLAYDLAHAASGVATARSMLDYGSKGPDEARLTCAFVADTLHDLATRVIGRERWWGAEPDALEPATEFVATYRDPEFLASLVRVEGPRHLDADFELVQDTFRRFADDRIVPVAEHVHRTNGDVPEEVIAGLSELGAFGLSVPEEYGGYASGGEHDYMGMVVATEELSRGSLGIGGSLITRPEILTRALVKGGTEEQKQAWLPKLATGEWPASRSRPRRPRGPTARPAT
jgi:(2S)-methylsuccinyl-CoA dehydrogenase